MSARKPQGDTGPDWVSTVIAARILSVAPRTLYASKAIKDACRRKKAGKNHRRGMLWFKADVELIVSIRRRYKLRTESAARAILNGLDG